MTSSGRIGPHGLGVRASGSPQNETLSDIVRKAKFDPKQTFRERELRVKSRRNQTAAVGDLAGVG